MANQGAPKWNVKGSADELDGSTSLDDTRLFINRELSWLDFNRRVLEEAEDPTQPLLERVKFLAICSGNLDEFFMSRVPGLVRQSAKGALEPPPDGMSPAEQLEAIAGEVGGLLEEHARVWNEQILPELDAKGIHVRQMRDLQPDQKAALRKFFERDLFPILTPLAFDLNHPFPFISSGAINLAVVIRDNTGHERFARVKVPSGSLFPRLIRVDQEAGTSRDSHYVFLEDLVAANLDLLFTGVNVVAAHPFRVTRDAEFEIELDETHDLLTAMEEGLESRRVGEPVRLEAAADMPKRLVDMLASKLELASHLIYRSTIPLALADLWQLHGIGRPDLQDTPFLPNVPKLVSNEQTILTNVAEHDVLLYHPYDSFQPLITFLKQAAVDPEVMAIKITFYRIDSCSPLVDALMEARRNGKAVAAVLELKAKFDEVNNISWARQLEHAGVHVVYGPVDIKIHAKMCLVVKKSRDGPIRLCHLSSGNYNSKTARTYGDIGYLTSGPDIAADVSDLFNSLTGYCRKDDFRKLLVSPGGIRRGIVERIDREIAVHRERGSGHIAFKLNALIDKGIIQALYRASMAGVKVDLNVRGLCSLRPGVPGISDNIRVTSIISRFLEHSRIYCFRNGGDAEVLLGSSDMMTRNLDRRVEILFPVRDPRIREAVIKDILEVHLRDNVKARELQSDGSWRRVVRKEGEEPLDSQEWLLANRGVWHGEK
ncbi:MAG: polyphosphate kinase 1 [Methanomassiliicoccus sp.]|nr:polyphosphate kinase 1 [Methanomassiliicoccus sp.]